MHLGTGLAFLLLAATILFIPFRIVVTYQLLKGDDDLHLEVVWLGITIARLTVPLLSLLAFFSDLPMVTPSDAPGEDGNGAEAEEPVAWRHIVQEVRSIPNVYHRYQFVLNGIYIFAYGRLPHRHQMPLGQPFLGYLFACLYPFTRHFEKLHWYTKIGLGDAAATAIAIGALSGLKAAGFSWLQRRVDLDSGNIQWQVIPNYSQRQIDMVIDCILRVNAGHIIITGAVNCLRVGIWKAFCRKETPID